MNQHNIDKNTGIQGKVENFNNLNEQMSYLMSMSMSVPSLSTSDDATSTSEYITMCVAG